MVDLARGNVAAQRIRSVSTSAASKRRTEKVRTTSFGIGAGLRPVGGRRIMISNSGVGITFVLTGAAAVCIGLAGCFWYLWKATSPEPQLSSTWRRYARRMSGYGLLLALFGAGFIAIVLSAHI
jgi:hypothetical protein